MLITVQRQNFVEKARTKFGVCRSVASSTQTDLFFVSYFVILMEFLYSSAECAFFLLSLFFLSLLFRPSIRFRAFASLLLSSLFGGSVFFIRSAFVFYGAFPPRLTHTAAPLRTADRTDAVAIAAGRGSIGVCVRLCGKSRCQRSPCYC